MHLFVTARKASLIHIALYGRGCGSGWRPRLGTEAVATAFTMLPLSITILITWFPILVNVENIADRRGFSVPWGVFSGSGGVLPAVASDNVVPSGAVNAMACSSDVKGIISLMMHPMSPGVPSKVLASAGSAS